MWLNAYQSDPPPPPPLTCPHQIMGTRELTESTIPSGTKGDIVPPSIEIISVGSNEWQWGRWHRWGYRWGVVVGKQLSLINLVTILIFCSCMYFKVNNLHSKKRETVIYLMFVCVVSLSQPSSRDLDYLPWDVLYLRLKNVWWKKLHLENILDGVKKRWPNPWKWIQTKYLTFCVPRLKFSVVFGISYSATFLVG